MAYCKSCAKKRKKSSVGALSDFKIETAVGAILGAVVAGKADEIALNKIAFLAQNNYIKQALKVGLGVYLSTMDNEYVSGAGVGMIAKAGGDLVSAMIPPMGGAAGAGGSDTVSGIYGQGQYQLGTGPVNIGSMMDFGTYENMTNISGAGMPDIEVI